MDWQLIDSAPTCDADWQRRVLIIGGMHKEPVIALADGDYWRRKKVEGSIATPTHWMPLPTPPVQ